MLKPLKSLLSIDDGTQP